MSDLSKRGPKEAKFMNTEAFVFTEVNLDSVKSSVWKYFLRDKQPSEFRNHLRFGLRKSLKLFNSEKVQCFGNAFHLLF